MKRLIDTHLLVAAACLGTYELVRESFPSPVQVVFVAVVGAFLAAFAAPFVALAVCRVMSRAGADDLNVMGTAFADAFGAAIFTVFAGFWVMVSMGLAASDALPLAVVLALVVVGAFFSAVFVWLVVLAYEPRERTPALVISLAQAAAIFVGLYWSAPLFASLALSAAALVAYVVLWLRR